MLRRLSATTSASLLLLSLSACGGGGSVGAQAETGASGAAKGNGKLVIGFSQVGAEGGWRVANTKSIQSAATGAGIDLKFDDADGQQDKQIKAIRGFIAQKVDVIAFSPVVETGWDAVLQEAKAAHIPVIVTDRAVDSKDTSLYKSFLGSDFQAEGKKAGDWLVAEYKGKPGPINLVQIEGTTGSAPANDRKAGFMAQIGSDPRFKMLASETGDFTRAKGREVMAKFLKAYPKIDVLYAHNDDMALGAIEAITAAGKKPGVDIKIISVDATRDGMTALSAGKINEIVECSPLLGPQLMDLAKKVASGSDVPARVLTIETQFDPKTAKEVLPSRQY